jgi:hypothetical protein
MSRAWWYTLVIPALGRQRQEDGEFQTSLGIQSETPSKINQTKNLGKI